MDIGAWQTTWGCKRIGHDLVTKQHHHQEQTAAPNNTFQHSRLGQ